MRSPVRIRPSAPRNVTFRYRHGGWFFYSSVGFVRRGERRTRIVSLVRISANRMRRQQARLSLLMRLLNLANAGKSVPAAWCQHPTLGTDRTWRTPNQAESALLNSECASRQALHASQRLRSGRRFRWKCRNRRYRLWTDDDSNRKEMFAYHNWSALCYWLFFGFAYFEKL